MLIRFACNKNKIHTPGPRARADVKDYASSCHICHRAKSVMTKYTKLVQLLGLWIPVSLDVIINLPAV